MRSWVAALAGWVVLAAVAGFPPRVFGAGLEAAMTPGSRLRVQGDGQKGLSKADLLDLNTATAGQLRELPGMGDAYVRRILDARPYTAKNQLLTRGVLPQSAYEAIRERVVAHRASRQP